MNRTLAALVVLILLGGGGWYVISHAAPQSAPENSGQETSQQSGNEWPLTEPNAQGIQFQYPPSLGTKYISTQEWPPSVELVGGGFNCVAGSATGPGASVEERTIGGKTYCIATISEGAAGSVYKTYEYSTAQSGDFSARIVFTLRFPQCGNYGEAEEAACEAEQKAFTIDSIVDQIEGSIRML